MAADPIVLPYTRQLNMTIPGAMAEELEVIAKRLNRNLDQVVLIALGLLKIAVEAPKKGQKLALVDENGRPISEIVVR